MALPINQHLQRVSSPPIEAAQAWLSESRPDLALIDMGQAVPSDPPSEDLRQRVAAFALQQHLFEAWLRDHWVAAAEEERHQ